MPCFSKSSLNKLRTCDDRLVALFSRIITGVDCRIIYGHRGRELQDKLFTSGHSQLRYPHSKHNAWPALAVDVAPYPIDWEDRYRFAWFAGYVAKTARDMSIELRWGGDWDRDTYIAEHSFLDMPHFELVNG